MLVHQFSTNASKYFLYHYCAQQSTTRDVPGTTMLSNYHDTHLGLLQMSTVLSGSNELAKWENALTREREKNPGIECQHDSWKRPLSTPSTAAYKIIKTTKQKSQRAPLKKTHRITRSFCILCLPTTIQGARSLSMPKKFRTNGLDPKAQVQKDKIFGKKGCLLSIFIRHTQLWR